MIKYEITDNRESVYVDDVKDFLIKKQSLVRRITLFGITLYRKHTDYSDSFSVGENKTMGFNKK